MDVDAEIMIIDPGGNLTPVNQCIVIHFTDRAVRLTTISTIFRSETCKVCFQTEDVFHSEVLTTPRLTFKVSPRVFRKGGKSSVLLLKESYISIS